MSRIFADSCDCSSGRSVDRSDCGQVRRVLGCFFFFSSRRRHTRCSRDWSSDVCSSDLLGAYQLRALARVPPYAAVSTSVELARALAGEKAARYVNQALRKIARETGSGKRETSGATHPSWLVARWRRRFGPTEADRLVAWNDT